MTTYKAAVIGLGRIGADFEDNHCSAYAHSGRTELVAVCDTLFSKAISVADRFNAKPYSDAEAMVKTEKLDIVSVCVPHEKHSEVINDVVSYVKAIYCEKPIANTIKDAQSVINACKKAGVILQVNHQRRFINPVFRYSRGIMNTGTHMFDLLRELFGEIEIVTSYFTNDKLDPNIGGVIRTERGLQILILPEETDKPVFKFDCAEIFGSPLTLGVIELCDCLDQKRESKSSGVDGLEALKLVLKFKELADESKG